MDNYRNYITVKIYDERFCREFIQNYEVKFDRYKRINVMGHASFGRWFEYKGRSIIQLKKMLDERTVKAHSNGISPVDCGFKNCFIEIIEVNIPDNPKENEIFDKIPELYLGWSDEGIIFLLPELKKIICKNLKKEPNEVIEFSERILLFQNYGFPGFFDITGEYGYNKFGKPRCKLKHFSYNPGGRFSFNERSNFTKLQNLIKLYIEDNNG